MHKTYSVYYKMIDIRIKRVRDYLLSQFDVKCDFRWLKSANRLLYKV